VPPSPVTDLAVLPDLVLGPLAGRTDADWYHAPPGKWGPAQIVQHLALGVEYSARTFESRRERAPMRRRPRSPRELIAYALVLGVGWIPGRRRAPSATLPAEQPERTAVERQFREAVERFLVLERELLPARRVDLFAKHPVLGDLTLPEWGRFHIWHCRHHARQIRARLAG
jgi:DinB family protein